MLRSLLGAILFLGLTSCITNPASAPSVDRDAIRRHILANVKSFRKCYNDLLATQPKAGGKLVAKWDILESGKVTNVSWPEFDTSMEPSRQCMTNVLSGIVFEGVVAVDQVVHVEKYPFIFNPDRPSEVSK